MGSAGGGVGAGARGRPGPAAQARRGDVSRETIADPRRPGAAAAARRCPPVVVTVAVIIALSGLISSVTGLVVSLLALWHAFHHTHGPGQ